MRARGFMGAELLVSTAIMFLLAAITVDVIADYRAAADENFWRRAAFYAADAQLQRYRAGAALDSQPPSGLIPENVKLETRIEPGTGEWSGLVRVVVTARIALPSGRVARESLAGYLRKEAAL